MYLDLDTIHTNRKSKTEKAFSLKRCTKYNCKKCQRLQNSEFTKTVICRYLIFDMTSLLAYQILIFKKMPGKNKKRKQQQNLIIGLLGCIHLKK